MYAEKFAEALNEGFDLLVNEEIIEDVRYLEKTNSSPTQIGVEKNFTNNTHKIAILYFNDNVLMNKSDLTSLLLQIKNITQVKIFENKVFLESGHYFDTLEIENSYDSTGEVRKEIKKSFDAWFPYDEDFLDACLNCFDGDQYTLLNGISFNSIEKINYITCHTFPNGNFLRYKKIIETLCELYEITTTGEDKLQLDEIIQNLTPILSCPNTKLSFELNQSTEREKEISLIIHPTINEFRHDVIKCSSECLVKSGIFDETTANQLDSWHTEQTATPSHGRLKGYLKIKILKSDCVKTEVLSCYGVF